jgi:S1-C subfamily serine protease
MKGTPFPPSQPNLPQPEPESRWTLRWQRVRGWTIRRRTLILVVANILVTLLILFVHDVVQPAPPNVTQRDIDAAVGRTLASATPLPPTASVVYSVIQPSMVLVHGQYVGRDQAEDSIGSGVIMDSSGNVLSALHVVKDSNRIEIIFADGLRTDADILEKSEEKDIVVLQPRIVPDDVIPAVLAGTPQVGEEVFAVGNPFAIPDSITAGIVSGLGRSYVSRKTGQEMSDLIQFDAAVNPGNSGGPLLNRNGEVVGIVTSLLNPTDQDFFVGIGFAVPIMTAAGVGGEIPY